MIERPVGVLLEFAWSAGQKLSFRVQFALKPQLSTISGVALTVSVALPDAMGRHT